MSWTPISGVHAIERCRIQVNYTGPIPEKVRRRLRDAVHGGQSEHGLEHTSPLEPTELIQMPGAAGQMFKRDDLTGWRVYRDSEKKDLAEVVQIEPSALVYENTEYARWPLFLERYLNLASEALSIAGDIVSFDQLVLEYWDRFTWDNPSKKALPAELFVPSLFTNMPDSVKNGEEHWHIHRGWFETASDKRLLINQNADCNTVTKRSDQSVVKSVLLYTKVIRRSADNGEFEAAAASSELDTMHDLSKRLVADILQPEVKSKIGLGK